MAKSFLDPAETEFFEDLQINLARRKRPFPKKVSRICAVDAAYSGDRVVAVASLFDAGRLAEVGTYAGTCSLPYVSGLFYLREGPFVVQAVRGLRIRPQLLCFDAHGGAHPRRAGLATTCGMVLGIPSIGCAKSLLAGTVVPSSGRLDKIVYKGRTVGFITHVNGVNRYWSAGYSVSLRKLESLVIKYAHVFLRALSESDHSAREGIRAVTSLQSPLESRK